MSSKKLLEKLKCPECGSDCFSWKEKLQCAVCGRIYNVRENIPDMLQKNIDVRHLVAEKGLFEKMKEKQFVEKDKFSNLEWKNSKEEFWKLVEKGCDNDEKNILNIGSGSDGSFAILEEKGFFFVNMDIVKASLVFLQKKFGAENCVLGDIRSIPFKDNSFEIITCIDIIHHEIESVEKIFKAVKNILCRGGKLYIQDVNALGLYQFYKSLFLPKPVYKFLRKKYHKLKKSDHIPADYEFPTNPKKIERILESVGFKNITMHKCAAYPEIGKRRKRFYDFLDKYFKIGLYHNYHYIISAEK